MENGYERNVGKIPEGNSAPDWINLSCSRSAVTTLRYTQVFDSNVVNVLASSSPKKDYIIDDDINDFAGF